MSLSSDIPTILIGGDELVMNLTGDEVSKEKDWGS
jgi:hypothetical protein